MPDLQIPRKIARALTSRARLIVLIGGRSSAKSESVGRIMLMKAQTERADVLCGREFQASIDDSVHKLLRELIQKLDIDGVHASDKKIDFEGGGMFRYKGFARNSSAIRSAQGFKYSWIEEGQDLSEKSLQDLLPTIRAGNSQLWFTANPMASTDPFSKRFIVPFKKELDRDGFYEDEMHLIIKMNWRDNPWHGELETQRQWDYEHLPRAEYDHIWEGEFNDSVEDSIIKTEWFDAAVDAHLKLGIEPVGMKVLSHDPADEGGDSKGLCLRHGSVILDAEELTTGDVNEGCDWALDRALEEGVDLFTWDGDGMGISLKRQVADALYGKKIDYLMFRGSERPDNPDEIYEPDERMKAEESLKGGPRTNRDTFLNKRAQYYWRLRDGIYKAYEAVVKKKYRDPNDIVCISSKIERLPQFRSEVCRIPRKKNGRGLMQIMTKEEMFLKHKIVSPALADSAMMNMEIPELVEANEVITFPQLQRF